MKQQECVICMLTCFHLPSSTDLLSLCLLRLRIPRRPAWQKDMSSEALDQQERAAFLEWRRDLAK